MTKRRSQVEVTKILNSGEKIVTVNKNKMNQKMCEDVIARLEDDWDKSSDESKSNIKYIKFKCVCKGVK